MGSLAGKVAAVTGASRGMSGGIALALAEHGATADVTGRTVTPGSYPLSGTAGEAAAECDARGGKRSRCRSIMIRWRHCSRRSSASRVGSISVNNAFSLPEDLTKPKGFWEKRLSNLEMFDVGVRSNFIAAWHAAKIMGPQKSGLIVEISGYTGVIYTYGVVFGAAKSAADRMARDMAIELKPHKVASISMWQGLTFPERAQRNLAAIPDLDDAAATTRANGLTVEHPGRVIAALAADPDVMRHSGGTFITAELADTYGVTDIDGRTIPSLRATHGSPIWEPV